MDLVEMPDGWMEVTFYGSVHDSVGIVGVEEVMVTLFAILIWKTIYCFLPAIRCPYLIKLEQLIKFTRMYGAGIDTNLCSL